MAKKRAGIKKRKTKGGRTQGVRRDSVARASRGKRNVASGGGTRATRRIGGVTFGAHGGFSRVSKMKADLEARRLRRKGQKARVIQTAPNRFSGNAFTVFRALPKSKKTRKRSAKR